DRITCGTFILKFFVPRVCANGSFKIDRKLFEEHLTGIDTDDRIFSRSNDLLDGIVCYRRRIIRSFEKNQIYKIAMVSVADLRAPPSSFVHGIFGDWKWMYLK